MTGPGESRGHGGARRAAADHDDVDTAGARPGVTGRVAPAAAHRGRRRSRPGGRRTASDLGHGPQAAGGEQGAQLDARVRAPHRQRPVVARVPVARRERERATRAPSEWCRARTRSLTTTPCRATRAASRRNATASARLEVVQDERGVDDVERAVRPGERPAVGDHEHRGRPRSPSRGSSVAGRVEDLRAGVDAGHAQRAPRWRPTVDESASGMSAAPGAHVEQRVRPRAAARAAASSAPRRRRGAAEPAVDPREVAQVAAQGRAGRRAGRRAARWAPASRRIAAA